MSENIRDERFMAESLYYRRLSESPSFRRESGPREQIDTARYQMVAKAFAELGIGASMEEVLARLIHEWGKYCDDFAKAAAEANPEAISGNVTFIRNFVRWAECQK